MADHWGVLPLWMRHFLLWFIVPAGIVTQLPQEQKPISKSLKLLYNRHTHHSKFNLPYVNFNQQKPGHAEKQTAALQTH